MKKLFAMLTLALNSILQLGGAYLMLFEPKKAATDVFGVGFGPDVARLLAVLGAVVCGCVLLSSLALTLIARGHRSGFDLALSFGAMLMLAGIIMTASGTSAGAFDVAKGIAIVIAAWLARPRATATTLAGHAASPPSSRLPAS